MRYLRYLRRAGGPQDGVVGDVRQPQLLELFADLPSKIACSVRQPGPAARRDTALRSPDSRVSTLGPTFVVARLQAVPAPPGCPRRTQNTRDVRPGKFDPLQVPAAGQAICSALDEPRFQRTGLLPVQIVWFDRRQYLKGRSFKFDLSKSWPVGVLLQPAPKPDGTVGNSPADIGLRLLLRAPGRVHDAPDRFVQTYPY